MNRKLPWIVGFAIAPIVACAALAYAGSKASSPVSVQPGIRRAQGSIGSTRNSADSFTYLGCYVTAQTGSKYATCYAQDAADHGACFTSNANIISTIEATSGDSWVSFEWDASGNCTKFTVDNGSTYEPKK
jgi:hypothetical protein